jgi:hypothetical protein
MIVLRGAISAAIAAEPSGPKEHSGLPGSVVVAVSCPKQAVLVAQLV